MKSIIELNYQEKDGLLYPILKIEGSEKLLGKYGDMAMKYLREESPSRYDYLLAIGDLFPMMHRIEEEALEKIHLLMEKMLEEKPLTDPNDLILSWQEREQVKSIAEEIVLNEIVFVKR